MTQTTSELYDELVNKVRQYEMYISTKTLLNNIKHMENNNITAVEWLEQEFIKLEATIGVHGKMYELIEQAKQMEEGQNKKEKCWVIRNSAGHILCVHKTINDEQLKDYRKQGLYTDEYVLSD